MSEREKPNLLLGKYGYCSSGICRSVTHSPLFVGVPYFCLCMCDTVVMAGTVKYGVTKRGKRTLLLGNHEYWFHRQNTNNVVVWRCCKFTSLKCHARVKTLEDRVLHKFDDHTHEGNRSKSLARKAVGEMKERMNDALSQPSTSQAAVASTLPDHVLMALPKKETLSRALRRHRTKVASEANDGQMLPPIPTNANFDIPEKYRDLVLHDSLSDTNEPRIIVMGDRTVVDAMMRAKQWLGDGTFKVVPTLFYQLYTHFVFDEGVNPAALYCLLPDKTQATYQRLMPVIRNLMPQAAPEVILTDFEMAPMNVLRAAYPAARITGCYFHLTQSVLRKVQELGLKTAYETDETFCQFARCLSALAFVPENDVADAFDELVEDLPQHERIEELVTYFEHSYIRGRRLRGRGERYGPCLFSIPTWNKRDDAGSGLARTTNICEGWHNALQSLFSCQHPTMWTFLDGMSKDINSNKGKLLQAVAGAQHPRQKRYRELQQRTTASTPSPI